MLSRWWTPLLAFGRLCPHRPFAHVLRLVQAAEARDTASVQKHRGTNQKRQEAMLIAALRDPCLLTPSAELATIETVGQSCFGLSLHFIVAAAQLRHRGIGPEDTHNMSNGSGGSWRIIGRSYRCVCVFAIMAIIFASPVISAISEDLQGNRAELIRSLLPAVVNISVRKDVAAFSKRGDRHRIGSRRD